MIKSKNTESGERRYWLKVGARQRISWAKGKAMPSWKRKAKCMWEAPPRPRPPRPYGAWPLWGRGLHGHVPQQVSGAGPPHLLSPYT